jgi:membrane protein involved in D-alanine export
MLPFSSFEFFVIMAAFIAIIVVCKYLIADKWYKYVLALLNALFLIVIYPKPIHFLSLIVFSYLITYLASDIFRFRKKIWGILLLLLPMLIVKFDIRFDFYPFKINDIISFAGLSYASFRIMGYYMDKAPVDKMAEPITYFNFLSFTPTLLIGPIERYNRFRNSQELGFSNVNADNFILGWKALIKGIAFKYVVAEVIDRYWLNIFPHESKQLLHMANNMYAYYFYLFFDFAGYSFMALGIGKMLGIAVPLNFRNPFFSVNPQDFWRKFHISLGEWLKDYFFTPLYMVLSRQKRFKKYPVTRQNIALILTFLLMGCWNGFNFNYILSGFLLGVFSAVHNTYIFQCKKKGRDVIFGKLNPLAVKIISIFIMFNLISVALYIFSGRCPL